MPDHWQCNQDKRQQANTKQTAANTREKHIETMQAQNEKGLLN